MLQLMLRSHAGCWRFATSLAFASRLPWMHAAVHKAHSSLPHPPHTPICCTPSPQVIDKVVAAFEGAGFACQVGGLCLLQQLERGWGAGACWPPAARPMGRSTAACAPPGSTPAQLLPHALPILPSTGLAGVPNQGRLLRQHRVHLLLPPHTRRSGSGSSSSSRGRQRRSSDGRGGRRQRRQRAVTAEGWCTVLQLLACSHLQPPPCVNAVV